MTITEWDHREICPDGACIGVIGPDGLCKVCGRAAPNWGSERMRGLVDDQTDAPADDRLEPDPADADDDDDDDDIDDAPVAAAASPAADDWDRRELCPNGACVGVIGADRKCTVCGSGPA